MRFSRSLLAVCIASLSSKLQDRPSGESYQFLITLSNGTSSMLMKTKFHF